MSPGSKNKNADAPHLRLAARSSNLWLRARIIQSIREFFIRSGYLEVETPNLIHSPAPEAHIEAVGTTEGFMHTSPELCMKRLVSSGHSMIFQICKCYRKGERGKLHLPEFTLLEWYREHVDYMGLMDECEEMIRYLAGELELGTSIDYQDNIIDLRGPWERLTVTESFRRYSPISLEEALYSDRFDEIMVSDIEPQFGISRPVFLYDYPASLASLARLKESELSLAERFELYMGGLELANGFSELTDAHEQEERFRKENERRRHLGKKEYPLPEKFIRDLQRMPPSAGIAVGIDRLVMIFTNRSRIDDVVSFTPEEI